MNPYVRANARVCFLVSVIANIFHEKEHKVVLLTLEAAYLSMKT